VSADHRYEFELLTGRTIRLVGLDQHWTYGGLLAGHPSREMNRHIMRQLVAGHTRPAGCGVPVLLEPLETPVEKVPFDPDWSTAADLPAITCIARFMSDVRPDDADSIASTLCVIWFQDEFAFPVDPHIRVEFAALDWESRARG
jgi:hypothetical protein